MRQIVEMYGRAFLYAICLVMLFIIVFRSADAAGNKGIIKQVGQKIKTSWTQDDDGGFDRYEEESREVFPDIIYCASGALTVGTYNVDEIIAAYDGAGNSLECKVTGIKYPNNSMFVEVMEISRLTFDTHGIYEICVRAKDSDNRKIVKCIVVPVNEDKKENI